jgi:ureidoacrylate peracid hydrolase
MHKPTIHPDVVSRATERRGRLRVFDSLAPRRTAHIVVDLQNGFMAPGAVAEIGTAREIVPNVNRISAALRQAGGLVVYIQNTFDEIAVATWSTFFDHFCSPARRQRMIETFSPGAFGHAIWPGLDVLPQDLKVQKRRFGAFAPGASDLHAILQQRGIDTLIISRHRDPGVLRVHRARCDDAELQGVLHRRRQRDVQRRRAQRHAIGDGACVL